MGAQLLPRFEQRLQGGRIDRLQVVPLVVLMPSPLFLVVQASRLHHKTKKLYASSSSGPFMALSAVGGLRPVLEDGSLAMPRAGLRSALRFAARSGETEGGSESLRTGDFGPVLKTGLRPLRGKGA